ncbi:MAG: ATP-binding protein [Elusimicrobiota bacterium]
MRSIASGLSCSIAPDLSPVLADKRRLTQVLGNLLENALRHTPKGGGVTVLVERQDREVRFAVRDTGDGIAPEELRKIFESFYQSNAPGGQHGRLGLGLSIAKEIVSSHGGRLWVESQGLGKGATFYFTIPAAENPR